MSAQSFFPGGVVPPVCPKCGLHLAPGDSVQHTQPPEEGEAPRFAGDREHVDCDNPRDAVVEFKVSPARAAIRKLRGEQA